MMPIRAPDCSFIKMNHTMTHFIHMGLAHSSEKFCCQDVNFRKIISKWVFTDINQLASHTVIRSAFILNDYANMSNRGVGI